MKKLTIMDHNTPLCVTHKKKIKIKLSRHILLNFEILYKNNLLFKLSTHTEKKENTTPILIR